MRQTPVRLVVVAWILLPSLVLSAPEAVLSDGAVRPQAAPGGGAPGPDVPMGKFPEEPRPAQTMKLTLPGSGFGIDELGRLDPGGALQIGIPIGYTLSKDQFVLGAWASDNDDRGDDWVLQDSLSLGLGPAGGGLSITAVAADRADQDGLTAHVQKQLWRETRSWPAISAGVFDAADNYERSYYVAATKRLGGRHPKHMSLRASHPTWPADAIGPSEDLPSTWGRLRLLDRAARPADQPDAPAHITVPSSKYPPRLDGMFGVEWDDAAQVRVDLPDQECLLLGLKHNGAVLYVGAGVPSDRRLTDGSRVDLFFEAPGERADEAARWLRYTLRWAARHGRASCSGAVWRDGKWRPVKAAPSKSRSPHGPQGTVSGSGDGAWRYPVFEFALPLSKLGLDPAVQELGFCARVVLPAGQHPARLVRAPQHTVRWPMGRGSYTTRGRDRDVFAARPDLWGSVLLASNAAGEGRIAAPMTAQTIQIDGELEQGEWQDAGRRTAEVAPGVQQTVYLARSRDELYVASCWDISAGTWVDQVVEVFVDPKGDGGIFPRDDDRLLKIEAKGEQVALQTHSWHEGRKKWVVRESVPFVATVSMATTATGSRSVAELSVPLRALGCTAPKPNSMLGLGVQTAVTAVPARMVAPGARVEEGSGTSTYVTAAWGSGVYDHRVVYGISHPVGSYRGIAEYDGGAANYGISGPLPGMDRVRLTVGYTDPDDGGKSGALVGAALTTRF